MIRQSGLWFVHLMADKLGYPPRQHAWLLLPPLLPSSTGGKDGGCVHVSWPRKCTRLHFIILDTITLPMSSTVPMWSTEGGNRSFLLATYTYTEVIETRCYTLVCSELRTVLYTVYEGLRGQNVQLQPVKNCSTEANFTYKQMLC